MMKPKRTAEQQVADEADRKALNPIASRQTISDSQAEPEFQENHKRLKADRLARAAGEGEIMPARVSHLPTLFERDALQKLRAQGELPAVKLASSQTVKKMLAKGWIERANSNRIYVITSAGEAAL